MTLTDYKVKSVPADMSEAAFLAVLRAASSPVSDGAARQVYSYCLARTLSPAYLLAMFHHESTYGRFGSAAETCSWGNTRPPSFGVPHLGVTERTFSKYANWVDGGVSTIARHFDYAVYLGKNTVREVIPTWAPPIENSTERYIAAVLADIEKWVTPVQPSLDLTMREAIIPATNANRPGYAMTPTHVTIHETANFSAGANAEMHRKFVTNGGGSEGVSFHWVVDDAEAIHLVPDDEVAWHAGDGATGPGNRKSIAIETCVDQGSDWGRTRRNLAILTATLMHRHGIPLTNVVMHNFWSGKNCPLVIRRDGLWAGQLAATKVAYEALAQPANGGIYASHSAKWNGGIYASATALWG